MNNGEDLTKRFSVLMVVKAMELLEVLSAHPNGLTVQEMVEHLNYLKTSVYKTAYTLYEKGYLGRDKWEFRFFLSRNLEVIRELTEDELK